MSLVENLLSLEPKPKRQKIDPGTLLNCDHWFVRNGICTSCNSTVNNFEGRSFHYFDQDIKMSHEGLAFSKRVISQTYWNEDKKLHLVLDLDHTLIHTIKVSNLSESEKYLIEEAESREDLWRFNCGDPSETLIKLRPFVHQFLKQCNELFSMYVYTRSGHEYAQAVLDFIDPKRIYFEDRVITRRESPGSKTLDLVLADERGTLIVDDTASVWPDHKRNLLQITKYNYFRSKDDLDQSKKCGKKSDESDERGPLASVLRILKRVHKGFFCNWSEEELDSMDVRPLLRLREPSLRSKRKAQVLV